MPGSHLNDFEKKMKRSWDNDTSKKHLTGIRIEGDPGLRGITSLSLDFLYPVTVICGKNGAGKTTVLALAALAYHSFKDFHPKNAKRKSSKCNGGSYYTFSNFFFKGPGDSDCLGVKISWIYDYGKQTIAIKKRSEKWMHYERRPQKAVQYLGTDRILSAFEQNVLRSYFDKKSKIQTKTPLNADFISFLSEILGREYADANDLQRKDYHIRNCTERVSYSSFNMGGGEDAIIELLSYIQAMPDESLCVIEEIELGIHPEALVNFARVIQKIAQKKKMQFIISSHSKYFIDNLPQCARVYLQRDGDELNVIQGPTTRYAMGEMSSCYQENRELVIICEDAIAEKIILAALPNTTRNRVSIIHIGGKSELAKAYSLYNRLSSRSKYLIVWDGDVTDSEAEGFINSAKLYKNKINFLFLHAQDAPEKNIVNAIKTPSGKSKFKEAFEISANPNSILSALSSDANNDSHDIFHTLAEQTNLDHQTATTKLIDCYLKTVPLYKEKIKMLVEKCLNGSEILKDHNR